MAEQNDDLGRLIEAVRLLATDFSLLVDFLKKVDTRLKSVELELEALRFTREHFGESFE